MHSSPRSRRVFATLVLLGAWSSIHGQDKTIALGDIAAGGDGTGTGDPAVVGIHPDTGILESFHINAPIGIVDGVALQPVDDAVSEFIDSVFIIESAAMPINTADVQFDFPAEDLLSPPQTWDHILKDRIGGEDYPAIIGGRTFSSSVGIHAAAGITYDLEALRNAHGTGSVGEVRAFAGMGDSPSCVSSPGSVTTYLILSDEVDVLGSVSHRTSVGGRQLRLTIPPEARYLTLAAGAGDGRFYCNSGIFADALLGPVSPVVVTRDLPAPLIAGEKAAVELDLEVNGTQVADVEVRERIPFTWRALNPRPPGKVETDAGGRETVVWKLSGQVQSRVLTYDLAVPKPYANVRFTGGLVLSGGQGSDIFGEDQVSGGSSANAPAVLVVTMKQALPPGCVAPACCDGEDPGELAQAMDFLTDGVEETELTVVPVAGASVSPDFAGASPSPGPTTANDLTWAPKEAVNGWFQLGNCDNCLSYLATYVVNPTGGTLRVRIGSASDDGEQILVDGIEVWNHSISRPAATAEPLDRSPLFDLAPGKHLVLQKVFDGCGGFNSSFRFEDEDSNPLVILPFTLDPSPDKPLPGHPGYPLSRAFVARRIPSRLEAGGTGAIQLKLRIKAPPIAGGTITEEVPAGWGITDVSHGGVRSGRQIAWTIPGGLADEEFSYTVQVPEGALDALFHGTAILGGIQSPIVGDLRFSKGLMTPTGFIKQWLVFGPLDTFDLWKGDMTNPNQNLDGPSATPEGGDLESKDSITNGFVGEKNIRPFDGMVHLPTFSGDGVTGAYSKGYEAFGARKVCAPAVPTWERFVLANGTFNNDDYFGGPVDSHTTLAAAYITNTTNADISTNVAIDSDDASIAFLDGTKIVAYEPAPCSSAACGRGMGGENSVVDVAPVTITPGEHFLLMRVHDGFGSSGHRLRFQDAGGNPLLPPSLTVSTLSVKDAPAAFVTRVLSGESYTPPEQIAVTLKIKTKGAHNVEIQELLPLGWSAEAISDGGALGVGQVTWTLNGVSGERNVTYRLVSGDCAAGGSFCGSTYKVDGAGERHALRGHDSFRRDVLRDNDPLGDWAVEDFGVRGNAAKRQDETGVDILGKGAGIRQANDECRFVHVPASGDFELTTRIDCMDDPAALGQGGLMVRDTLDPFSATVFFALSSVVPIEGGVPTGVGTLKAAFRHDTVKKSNSATISITDKAKKNVDSLPIYLRLKRAAKNGKNMILMERSGDGKNFTPVAEREIGSDSTQKVNLRNETLIGLTVTAAGGGSTRTDFRDVRGVPPVPNFVGVPPDRPTGLTAAGSDGKVSLAWTAAAGGAAPTGYNVYRGTASGGPYGKVADLDLVTSYEDTTVTNYCYVVRARRGSVESGDSNEACATPRGGVKFRRGDTDANRQVDLTDAITVLNFLFLGGPQPDCMDGADADDTGVLDLTDAVYSLNFQFLAGPRPPDPGPDDCNVDPTEDSAEVPGRDLGCRTGGCQ